MTIDQLDISGVYKITNFVNDKIYIGSSVNIRSRWIEHQWHLNRNSHHNAYLQNSWNLHKCNNFGIRLLEQCDKSSLIKREQFWLDKLCSFQRDIGYNICQIAGSALGRKDSPETKAKKSRSATGRKHTDASKKKMSRAKLGKPSTFRGKSHSSESRYKMSRSNQNTGKTHCKLGHEFTDKNTYYFVNPNGNLGRSCRKCKATREAKRRMSLVSI